MTSDQDKIKVLVTSIDGPDHAESSLGIAVTLHKRGNDVYFVNQSKYKSGCEYLGLKFISFDDLDADYQKNFDAADFPCLTKSMNKVNMPPLERLKNWTFDDTKILLMILREITVIDTMLRKLMETLRPDIIIADTIYPMALFMQNHVPTIPIYSVNPIGLYYKSGLLSGTGFSVKDKKLWAKYRDKEAPINEKLAKEYNRWYRNFGIEVDNMHAHRAFTRYFGIYIYPEALDYCHDLYPTPSNWVRLNPPFRKSEKFILPEPLASKPGKLIFLAIGTMTRIHLVVMNRLINTFTRSKHRFIVMKGPPGEQVDLPENMWGEEDLDEMSVIPEVDLIIGHGHNELIFESLFHAKPMMVLPLLFNHLDNAQRFEDLKLGYRVNPFTYDEADIHVKVETMLNDVDLHERIKKVSEQMRNSDNSDKIAEMIEQTARTRTSPTLNRFS